MNIILANPGSKDAEMYLSEPQGAYLSKLGAYVGAFAAVYLPHSIEVIKACMLLSWNFSARSFRKCWLTLLVAAILPINSICAQAAISFPVSNATPTDENATPEGHYRFRNYDTKDGLNNASIKFITQANDGFIWVATDDGVYNYDGYEFQYFGLKQGLPSTQIESMFLDVSDQLWVATFAGLARWNGQRFELMDESKGLDQFLVTDMTNGPGGPWIGTPAGPYIYEKLNHFKPIENWPGGTVSALTGASKGALVWLATWDGSARMQLWQRGHFKEFALPTSLQAMRIDRLLEDNKGRIWARNARSVWVLESGADAFVQVQTPIDITAARGFMHPKREGGIYLPSNRGLLFHQNETWTIIADEQGLPFLSARSAFRDRDGTLWIGSYGQGVFRQLGKSRARVFDGQSGFPDENVWVIHRDLNKQLWAGTQRGLVYAKNAKWHLVPNTEHIAVRTLVETVDGQIFFAGTPANQVFSLDPLSKTLRSHQIAIENRAFRINRLILEKNGSLWVASSEGGLFFSSNTQLPLAFEVVVLPDGNQHEIIGDGFQDSVGRLWIAGQYGLAMRENGVWRRFTQADGLSQNHVSFLRATHNGDLVFAYREPFGVTRAKYTDGQLQIVKRYDSSNSLNSDKVYLIGEDNHQRLWIGASNGLNIVDDKHADHIGTQTGLANDDVNNMAFLTEPDGAVWIGTSGGLSRIDSNLFKNAKTAERVSFVALALGKQALLASDSGKQFAPANNTLVAQFSNFNFADSNKTDYRARLLGAEETFYITRVPELRYTSLSFGQYQLEIAARANPHEQWGPTTTFAFKVLPHWWQTWWFKTVLLIAFLGVFVLLIRWRLFRLQERQAVLEQQVEQRTAELSVASQQQEQANLQLQTQIGELEQLNYKLVDTQNQLLQSEKMASVGQLAAGMAHEINTPISYVRSNLEALKGYLNDVFSVLAAYDNLNGKFAAAKIDIASVESIKQEVDIEYIRSDTQSLFIESREGITRVEKIVKDLKEFSHLDDSQWQYVDIHKGLESTLNMVRNEIKHKAELVKEYGNLPEVRCLPFQINQVVMNLLINASQAIEKYGKISVLTDCDEKDVWIQISDTGKGIPQENLNRIFDPFFTTKPVGEGTGLGLSLSYSIIKNHGGVIDVSSEAGKGTTFMIVLPISGPKQATANS